MIGRADCGSVRDVIVIGTVHAASGGGADVGLCAGCDEKRERRYRGGTRLCGAAPEGVRAPRPPA